ncbi:MAG: hypothetical protein AB7T74_04860 [Clostridia bacterium]
MKSPVNRCTCGHAPFLIRKGGQYWYHCKICGQSGAKAANTPGALKVWNEKTIERQQA